jgi:hypothetical protein
MQNLIDSNCVTLKPQSTCFRSFKPLKILLSSGNEKLFYSKDSTKLVSLQSPSISVSFVEEKPYNLYFCTKTLQIIPDKTLQLMISSQNHTIS